MRCFVYPWSKSGYSRYIFGHLPVSPFQKVTTGAAAEIAPALLAVAGVEDT